MTDDRLPWFACYPSKWLGALASMKPSEGYLYLIVCFRIYEVNGPCPDTLDALCRRSGFSKRVVSDALNALFKTGKLTRVADGIANPFADKILEHGRTLHEKRSNASRKAAEQRWGKTQENQTNDHAPRIANASDSDTQEHLQLHIESEVPLESESRSSKRRTPRVAMPDNWAPTDDGLVYARERGFDDGKIRQMVRACRDYHIRRGTLIAGERGLAATWRTWVENEIKFTREQKNGPGRSRAFQDDSRSLVKAADRLIEKAQRGEFTFGPRPGLPIATSEDAVRLLPQGGSSRS